MPSVDEIVLSSNVKIADCIAALVQVATLSAHPAFAPSQIIPVMFPMIFCIDNLIFDSLAPIKYMIPQHAPVAEIDAPHNADNVLNLI